MLIPEEIRLKFFNNLMADANGYNLKIKMDNDSDLYIFIRKWLSAVSSKYSLYKADLGSLKGIFPFSYNIESGECLFKVDYIEECIKWEFKRFVYEHATNFIKVPTKTRYRLKFKCIIPIFKREIVETVKVAGPVHLKFKNI